MSTTVTNDTTVLNALLSLCIDSAKAYREAAEIGKNSELADLFQARADERDRIAEQFQEEVSRHGAAPHEHGTIAGTAR